MNPLALAARHGRWVLVFGLVIGVFVPSLAQVLRPLVPLMVVSLLFLAVLRISPADVAQSARNLPRIVGIVLVLQLALPLLVVAVGYWAGAGNSPLLVALVLMTAAPAISGSPNFVLMLGHRPIHALRIMVIGTALLPLTVLPIFWALPQLGQVQDIVGVVGKLFLAITVTAGGALMVRKYVLPDLSRSVQTSLEGVSAILLVIFVVGLMPAVSESFLSSPQIAWLWLGLAFVTNFGMQLLGFVFTGSRLEPSAAVSISLIAGNRNIALFLVALPEQVTAPIMVFIGCYQIPMFLTPLLMQRLYQNRKR